MKSIIIIGAGPAGLTAAATLKQYGIEPLVLEAERVMATVYSYAWKPVENYPGFDGKQAIEIAKAFEDMINFFGFEVKEDERVVKAEKVGDRFKIYTERNEYETNALIIAIGILGKPRRLGLPNEDLPNVHHVVRDPSMFKDKKVVVVGGGDTAVDTATALALSGADVTIVHRRDQFRAPKRSVDKMLSAGVKTVLNFLPKEIIAEGGKAIALKVAHKETGEEKVLPLDDLIILIGYEPPQLDWIKDLGVVMRGREIVVDDKMRTNVKGVYAAGDITPAPKRILVAAAQGYIAGFNAFKYLRTGIW